MSVTRKIVAAINAPHFYCGVVLRNDTVIEAAPIVGYMKKRDWTRDHVRAYCAEKGWIVTVVREMGR